MRHVMWRGAMVAGILAMPGIGAERALAADPAAVSAPVSSPAGDHPPLVPTRDVRVEYHVVSGGQDMGAPAGGSGASDVSVAFSGAGDRMRIEAASGQTATILDRPRGVVILMMLPQRVFTVVRPRDGLHNPFMLDLAMHYTRKGTQSIAGVSCVNWAVHGPQGDAQACVTPDGVILSERGVDADGVSGALVAQRVTYGDLPDALFHPPVDFARMPRVPARLGQAEGPDAVPGGVPGAAPGAAPGATPGAPGAGVPEAPDMASPNAGSSVGGPEQPGIVRDGGQPSVANDSANDGSTVTPDQPGTGLPH